MPSFDETETVHDAFRPLHYWAGTFRGEYPPRIGRL